MLDDPVFLDPGIGLFKLCNFFNIMRLALRALSITDGMDIKRDEYYISNLAVLPRFRGCGIGSGLIAHVEAKARRAGLQKCSLIVDTEKPVAQRLYKHRGYRTVHTKTHIGAAKDPQVGYYHMVKELV